MKWSQISIVSSLILILLLASNSYGGVEFDGAEGDYIAFGDIMDFGTGSFTVMAWIKTSLSSSADRKIITKDDEDDATRVLWALQVEENDDGIAPDDATFVVYNTGTSDRCYSNADVNDGKWHCLVGLRDGSNLYFYLDGAVGTTDTDTSVNVTNADAPVWIGDSENGGGVNNFDGIITEVAVWDTDLTASEIALLAKSRTKRMSLQIQSANLVGYWALDDHPHNDTANSANGNTFKDLSGNGNDGTASGCNAQAEEVLSYP